MPENIDQHSSETEKKQERAEVRDLTPEQLAVQIEQTDTAIGLTLEHLKMQITPQLIEKQQQLQQLPSSILWDAHLWPQAQELQGKTNTYLQRIAAETANGWWSTFGLKGKEKIGKGTDITAQLWDIVLSKDLKLSPFAGVTIPNQAGKPWAIAGMTFSDKTSGVATTFQGEFKEKGKVGKEYIASKITEQTKLPISKTDSISVMWGIDDKQPTAGMWYTKKFDSGSLTVWGTITDTEKWPVNLKGDVTRTSKNKNVDITGTVQRNKGDVVGWVSAKVRF